MARLPHGACSCGIALDAWKSVPVAEQIALVDALIARVCAVRCRDDDADRAANAVCNASHLHSRLPPAAASRLLEVVAELVFDPQRGTPFCQEAALDAILLAGEERLRSSDPEMRRAAYRALSAYDPSWRFTVAGDSGDPYLEDLVPRATETPE